MKNESKQSFLRWSLAIFCLFIFAYTVPPNIYRYARTSQYFNSNRKVLIPDRKYNDLTDGAIQAKLNLSNNLFQIALLSSAALAGLLIAKNGEADFVLSDYQELIMFACSSSILLLSIVFNFLYVHEISYLYAIAGKLHVEGLSSIPDVFDENINFLFKYQFIYLLVGVMLAFITFFSAHKIKGGLKDEND